MATPKPFLVFVLGCVASITAVCNSDGPMQPFFDAADKDGDGSLDASEIGAFLQNLTAVLQVNVTYEHVDRLIALSDHGFMHSQSWVDNARDEALAGDGKTTLQELANGIHLLRHTGHPPCPAQCWCESVSEGLILTEVSDAYCLATPAKDIWQTLRVRLCTGGPNAEQAGFFAILLFFVAMPIIWLLPCCCMRLLGRCHHRRAAGKAGGATAVTPGRRNSMGGSAVDQLNAATNSAARLKARVSGTLTQLGWMTFTFSMLPWLFALTNGNQLLLVPIIGHFVYYLAPMPWALALMTLSLRPIDAGPILGACKFFVGFYTFMALSMFGMGNLPDFNSNGNPLLVASYYFTGFMFLLCGAMTFPALNVRCGPCTRLGSDYPPRLQLFRLWLCMRTWFFVMPFSMVFFAISPVLLNAGRNKSVNFVTVLTPSKQNDKAGFFFNALSFLLVALLFTRRTRGKVHRWLGSLGKSDSKEQEAASVAALINTKASAADAFEGAIKHFRAWPLSQLTREILAHNKPDTTLHAHTLEAKLGGVDAFVSHSWSDDGTSKFDKLQQWAATRTPQSEAGHLIWLDKACIDQTNIDANLASLPVFLSGCKELLVLAGSTYVSRLWCVMELFIFLRMGGARSLIDVKLLRADAFANMERFDAGKATCFLPVDRQKLLAVIEAGFGTFTPFNTIVRDIFGEKLGANGAVGGARPTALFPGNGASKVDDATATVSVTV